MKNRCVITGMGQVSCMGNSIEELQRNLLAGESRFSQTGYNGREYLLAAIKNFDFYNCGFKIKTYTDRASQICTYAVSQTMKSTKKGNEDSSRCGLVTASSFGCLDSAAKYLYQLKTLPKAKFASPLYFTHSICNIPNSIATIECGIKGSAIHLSGAGEAGLLTIWHAIQCIAADKADQIFAGGFDTLSDELLEQLESVGLVNRRTGLCQAELTYAGKRKNAIWGEGVAAICIEGRQHAIKRKENILGEIKGIGIATSYGRQQAIEQSMKLCLEKSNHQVNDIAFIVANANGTKIEAKREGAAIKNILGNNIPVFLPKSYFGETSAAAGILGIISILALQGGDLPRNKHLYNMEDINMGYSSVKIEEGSKFIVNGYNRVGTSVSICIEIGRGDD